MLKAIFRYGINAKRISKLAREKPNHPDEALVNWVNFVISNGRLPELKPELLNQSFITYNNLDIFGAIIAVIFVFIHLLKYLFYLFAISLTPMKSQVVEKTKLC